LRPVFPAFVLRLAHAALLVTIASIVDAHFLQSLGVHHPLIVFCAPVAVAAMFLGLEGGFAATIFSALSAAYFSFEPISRFAIARVVDQVYVGVFVLQGCLVSFAAHWMRRAKRAETERDNAKERARFTEQVRESEERLRLALESARMGMWSWDTASDLSDWNDQQYELLGLPRGGGHEPVRCFFDRIHPDDLKEMKIVLHQVLAQGQEFYHEYRIVRPDGEVRWLATRGRVSRNAEGKATLIRGVNYDITSHRTCSEELLRSERESRARANELAILMDTVPAITFIAHDPECRRMTGSLKSREILQVPEGKSVSASAPEGEQPGSFRGFKNGRQMTPDELPMQRAAKGEEIRNFEFTLVLSDGSFCDVLGNAVPLQNDSGKITGAIGAFIDITEQKRIQRELEKARNELEQRVRERTSELHNALEILKKETEERIESVNMLIHQSRLAVMGEMIGNIAHQWRQPLNTMGLIVQEVPMMYRSGEFSEEYLKTQMGKAKDLIWHMSQTIEDFRSFFRPTKDKLIFKAREMIEKTLNLVEDTLKSQQITVEVKSDDDPDIYGYLGECCQVLLNLLVNSRDAFLAHEVDAARYIIVRAFSGDGTTVITVWDNAGGIPDEIIHRIFEPYFTTKGPEKGTGLGLYMACNIIQRRMNGRFTVRNLNGGAEFRIEVPSREL
jgi:PAS domain S-box-containing protein